MTTRRGASAGLVELARRGGHVVGQEVFQDELGDAVLPGTGPRGLRPVRPCLGEVRRLVITVEGRAGPPGWVTVARGRARELPEASDRLEGAGDATERSWGPAGAF